MDYTLMTLAQLEAQFATDKARFEAIKASSAPTVAEVTEAQTIKANLEPGGELHAALTAARSFGSLTIAEFDLEKNPEGAEKAEAAPVEEQARTDAEGTHNTDDPAEQARVNHGEHVQDPVDPDQIKPGEVVGEDGKGVPLQTGEENGQTKAATSNVATLAARANPTPSVPTYRQRGSATLRAASGVEGFSGGETMGNGLLDVARGAISRVQSFPDFVEPTGQMREFAEQGVPQLQKFGTATIDLDVPTELIVDERSMSPEMIDEVLARAGDETTLPGGSLTAAGGWCAPSETTYDLTVDATRDGMLTYPEVGVRRGGLKWPISPDFATFYANPGFKYTEAQVIGGVTKPCVTIPCPSFDEARLSVEGLCIKVDILTNVGYPEVVRNYTEGTLIAHDHWMNATRIAAMVTAAGTAKTVAGQGSTTNDTLNYLEALGERTRQKYRLGLNSTLEVVVPFWVRSAIRMDLSNRTGLPVGAVTDQQIKTLFRERKMNVQFVYDWQDLPLVDVGGTAGWDESIVYPTTYQALMFPAGTFIFGTAPVINLSTVYDAASLAANQYTGLFTEQGWLVAKRKFEATLVTLPVCNAGRTGSANIVACGTAA